MRAATLSLALHLLAVPLFTSARDTNAGGGGATMLANETIRITTLTFDRPRATHRNARAIPTPQRGTPHPQPVVAAASQPRERRALVEPSRASLANASATSAHRHAHAGEPASDRESRHAARAALALTVATAAPERTDPPRAAPPPSAEPTSHATATATAMQASPAAAMTPVPAAPQPLAVAVAPRDGESAPGGWGQTFARPLVADDSVLATLRSRYRGVRTIAIDVDADGRATHVALPESLTGEARAELARALLAVRYVPAECNGLRCTGTLQLAL